MRDVEVESTATSPKLPGTRFTDAECREFERDGYLVVRQLAARTQVDEMRAAVSRQLAEEVGPVEYEAELQYPGAPTSRSSTGGNTIRRLKEAHARHPVFTHWVTSPSVVARLEQLLTPPVVMPLAHHNCIMTKQPRFSSETHWHQDIRYWSYQRSELVSLWLALGRETESNGCLLVIPGSHQMSFAPERYDGAKFLREDLPENQELISRRRLVELEPGDALFFHCRTFHAAGRNHTETTKYSVVFTFRPFDNPPLRGSRSASMGELLLPHGPP